MPLEWLETGLPSMRAWLLKLKSCWIPAQDTERALQGDDKAALRTAIQHDTTNWLMAKHCAPLWFHAFLGRLRPHVARTEPLTRVDKQQGAPNEFALATSRAIHSYVSAVDTHRAAILADIDEVLRLMEEDEVRQWLLRHTDEATPKVRQYTE